jgi:hypothetical protein
MARFPLVLSAHPSAWIAEAEPCERKADASATVICQFCGQPTAGWDERYHLNDDHADSAPENLALSCKLCHLTQHLNRLEIDSEAVLIWLPEMAQAALNVLARHIHLGCHAVGISPVYGQAVVTTSVPRSGAPLAAYRALHERATVADIRLGTSSPRQLGAALLELPPSHYERRATLLGGIRLLPLGRLFQTGRDIYPTMLRDWAALHRSPV